jgi:hypothetical protein
VLPSFSEDTVINTKDFFKNGDFKSPFTILDKCFCDTKAYALPIETWRRFDESLILSQVGLFNYCKARHVARNYPIRKGVTTRWQEFQLALSEIGCKINYKKKREEVDFFIEYDQYKNYVHPPYLWNGNSYTIDNIKPFFLDKSYVTQKWSSDTVNAKTEQLIVKGYLVRTDKKSPFA